MSKQYDDTDRGALFKNAQKENENQPDYKGNLNVGGTEYWISAWLKTSQDGKKYMSLSVTAKEQRKPGKGAQGKVYQMREELDGELARQLQASIDQAKAKKEPEKA